MDMRRITEVGVAVRDLEAATAVLGDLLGGVPGPIIDVPRYDMRFRMVRVGKVDFEIMEPTAPTGVIADFLAKRGEGLHHIAFAVDSIEATMDELTSKGVSFVDDAPLALHADLVDYAGRRMTGDIRFAFSFPKSILGILFEFIEYPEGYETP